MAVDESDSRGVWLLFVLCNSSVELFSVLHFSPVSILARGGSILPQCISVTTWYLHESEPRQHYAPFKNKHTTSFTSHSPACCTSFPNCLYHFLWRTATALYIITWPQPGSVRLSSAPFLHLSPVIPQRVHVSNMGSPMGMGTVPLVPESLGPSPLTCNHTCLMQSRLIVCSSYVLWSCQKHWAIAFRGNWD